MIKQIISVFIYDPLKKKFLLTTGLKNPDYPSNKLNFILDISNSKRFPENLVKKELKKMSGLILQEIFPLNWGSTYTWNGQEFKEMNFIAFLKSNNLKLNNKLIKYRWLSLNQLIKKIKWEDSKVLIKKVLIKGINKEKYFNKKEREN